jgi:hypothetical protein
MASPKEKAPAVPPAAPDPLAALADELGEIDRTLAPFRTRIARETALKSQMRAAVEAAEVPSDVEVRVAGTRFDVILGPKALEKSIDFKGLAKRIGLKAYAAFAKCTLKDLETHAPGRQAEVVTSAQTGPRSLKIFERAA